MDRFLKYKLDHVIFWVATIGFHMFTRIYLVNKAGLSQFLLEVIIRNSLLAVVIYINLLVLIPRLAQQKKVALYVCLVLVTFGFYVVVKNAHDVYLNGYVMNTLAQRDFFYNTYYNLSIVIFYFAFSVALYLSREWYRQRELIRQIELEKLNTELDYLRAQINPHFVFNSINTIYFQIDKQNLAARESLSAFSEMLRYQLYECNGKEIPVEKEIGYLKNYVSLQRMRKDENYTISFLYSDDLSGFSVAPLLLIPFVENAFKHVSHFSSGNEIRIELAKEENNFTMNVFNTKELKPQQEAHQNGIGLQNAQRRLALLYKDRHALVITEKPQSFDVTLKLKIS